MYTEKDYPELRKHFLEVFMKGTYRKTSYRETHEGGFFGTTGKRKGVNK